MFRAVLSQKADDSQVLIGPTSLQERWIFEHSIRISNGFADMILKVKQSSIDAARNFERRAHLRNLALASARHARGFLCSKNCVTLEVGSEVILCGPCELNETSKIRWTNRRILELIRKRVIQSMFYRSVKTVEFCMQTYHCSCS